MFVELEFVRLDEEGSREWRPLPILEDGRCAEHVEPIVPKVREDHLGPRFG